MYVFSGTTSGLYLTLLSYLSQLQSLGLQAVTLLNSVSTGFYNFHGECILLSFLFQIFFRSVLNTIVCHSTHSAKQNSGRCLVKYVQKQREVHNDTVNRASMIILWNVSMDTLDWIHHKLFFKRVPPLCFRVIILGFGTNKLRSWKYHGAGLC